MARIFFMDERLGLVFDEDGKLLAGFGGKQIRIWNAGLLKWQ